MKLPIIFISVLILLTGAFGYFVSWPLYQDWQSQQQHLKTLSTEIKALKQRRTQAKDLVASAKTIHDKAVIAKQLIPTTEARESFTSEYDAAAKQNGTTLAVLNFQKVAATKTATNSTANTSASSKKTTKKTTTLGTPLGFSSNLVGTYPNLRQLIGQMKTMPRYTRITSITILARENDATATIDGEIYTQPEPKTPEIVEVGPKVWEYLSKRLTTQTQPTGLSTGRQNPFIGY